MSVFHQLCWSCSQRQQNETLSSDEDDFESDAGSDDSCTTFVTNQFQDLDVRKTCSQCSVGDVY